MNALLVRIWRVLRGTTQWYILWLFHRKFVIGVSGVVFNRKGEILLLQHRFWEEGVWGLPSGYASSGETLEAAIAREVREETGYIIEPMSLMKIQSGFRLRVEVTYLARVVGGKERLDRGEVVTAQFFPREALPSELLGSHRELLDLAGGQLFPSR